MASSPPQYDVVVVGGGIGGLTAAYELREHRTLLLEAGEELGGRVRSRQHGRYWVNLGAQFLAGEGPLWRLVDELGVDVRTLAGTKPALAMKDRLVVSEMPARFALELPLSARGRVGMLRLGLKLRRTYKRLARNSDPEDARRFRDRLDAMSSSDYFASPRNEQAQAILRSFIRFWMGAEPEQVSAGHTALYIGLAVSRLSEVPPFSLVVGGNQQLPLALARALGDRVRTGARVDQVRPGEDGVEIAYTANGKRQLVTARECVLAVPAYTALELVPDLPAGWRQGLEAVRYGAYVNVGFFTRERGRRPWDEIYAATVVGRSFQSLTNPAAVLRGEERADGGALLAYAGGEPAKRLLERSDEEIVSTFRADLEDLLPALAGTIEKTVVQRWPRAIPYWEPGGRSVRSALRTPGGRLHLAADYLAYPSMQVAATAAEAAASKVSERLARR